MSSSAVATTILFISKEFATYGYFLLLIGGVFGNICNILVFACHKIFRQNQTAFYLISGSIIDCFLLLIVLPFRITELAFAYDTSRSSVIWCKMKAMISYALALITFSTVCFAAIDQYLSTNHHGWLKQLSTLKLAHRLVFSALVIWIVYGSIFLVFFELQPITGCAIYNIGFARYFSYFHYIFLNGVIPILISSSFSLLAYSNVRRIVQRRLTVVRRKLDKQLTAMVLTKVSLLVVTILPSIIFRIYLLNVTTNPNDPVRSAIEQLISNIAYALFYVNPSCTFYLFLLVSPRFRRQFKYTCVLVTNFARQCCKTQRENQIAPAPIERSDFE